MIGLMPGTYKTAQHGFTFIELALALLIMGILSTLVIPRLIQTKKDDWQQFVTSFNGLVQTGVLEARSTNTLHRIFFDLEHEKIVLQVSKKKDANPTDTGEDFVSAQSQLGNSSLNWPADLVLRSFFIGTRNEMTGGAAERIWFFIGPDGMLQDVSMIFFDSIFEREYTLAANPFTGQLTVYDGAQKPT